MLGGKVSFFMDRIFGSMPRSLMLLLFIAKAFCLDSPTGQGQNAPINTQAW